MRAELEALNVIRSNIVREHEVELSREEVKVYESLLGYFGRRVAIEEVFYFYFVPTMGDVGFRG